MINKNRLKDRAISLLASGNIVAINDRHNMHIRKAIYDIITYIRSNFPEYSNKIHRTADIENIEYIEIDPLDFKEDYSFNVYNEIHLEMF